MVTTTRIQKRGLLTVPHHLRTIQDWSDGVPVLCSAGGPDILLIRRVPDAQRFFAHYDAEVVKPDHLPSHEMPPRWLDRITIETAQMVPESAERVWLTQCSQGQTQTAVDPVILPEVLSAVEQWLPMRKRQEHAAYVQILVAWPGLQWPNRDDLLTALEYWGTTSEATWSDSWLTVRTHPG